ncbi:calcium-binding protein [Clostridium sp. NSJ-6]|uniref:Calcium-binding protein n=1 Tax=Clostridium hominis TaxID=2763036 RepID=A0ABR7DDS5_9CLOT|nr:calcium-binding protein [Clostridium hominis]MBC5629564.1 calcium-binding protein [Clostridium hominis]
MKIRIDDDYDKDDLEKFNINNNDSKYRSEQHQDDILKENVIETTFQEVYDYDKEYSRGYYNNYQDDKNDENDNETLGKITVVSRLANKNRTLISSAKINLYVLNGVSPKLVETKYTDNLGNVTFENLKKGSYRVIAIVDRKYFEKPTYSPWNEVTIDKNTTEASVEVVNKIKAV